MAGDLTSQIEMLPLWLQYWLRWLQLTLILAPLFFLKRREAQLIVVAQFLNFVVGAYVFYVVEDGVMTKLFGIGHVFWLFAYLIIVWRWQRGLVEFENRPYFRAWLFAAMITLTISLPLDIYDFYLYIDGTDMSLAEYYAIHRK